jgi:hypothetical protein
MDISKEKAEYIANKTNNLISVIFKKMTELESIISSEHYQAIFDSDKTEIIEVRELAALPYDFLEYLDSLSEML